MSAARVFTAATELPLDRIRLVSALYYPPLWRSPPADERVQGAPAPPAATHR